MPKFDTLTSRLIPLPAADVDTDQIIPARFLKVTEKDGLAPHLFAGWRYLADGKPNPDFPMNQPENEGAEILLAGDNFGCGSSREHAPWALMAGGIRAIVSTSFADIFRNNALKNGLLPVAVPAPVHEKLFALRREDPSVAVTVDLESCTLKLPDGETVEFPVDPFARRTLLEGMDELGYLLSFADRVEAFEANHG
jgi:3-isopropylmalate/(R)-2-methylmalate dehydratase small subunit